MFSPIIASPPAVMAVRSVLPLLLDENDPPEAAELVGFAAEADATPSTRTLRGFGRGPKGPPNPNVSFILLRLEGHIWWVCQAAAVGERCGPQAPKPDLN